MKVLSVVGARPQFIKSFPVSRLLRKQYQEVLLHTGQHYDKVLSGVFFAELDIPEPEYNLGIGSGSHGQQTGEMLIEIDRVINKEKPDVVLVYGDTNSTLAAAIAAAKTDATLGHVEAGLRSGKWTMPEEVNHVLTDHASDLLYPPSSDAEATLASEGIEDGVYEVGDVLYDALLLARDRAATASTLLSDLGLSSGEYILSTIHRPRNTESKSRLSRLLAALDDASHPVVLPLHPRTDERMSHNGLRKMAYSNIEFIEPVGYLDFVRLLDAAQSIVTDSGSIQKEAFYLDTPCITLREETEWEETVEAGWNVLVGADANLIQEALHREWKLTDKPTPYGDGKAAQRIINVLQTTVDTNHKD